MTSKLNYAWRTLATGISFSLFGVGGVLIALIVVPGSLLLAVDQRERFAKRFIHYAFKLFIQIMKFLGVLTHSADHLTSLKAPGQLIVANHPTLVDIVFLISVIPHCDCIVNSELLSNPFMSGAIRFAGYIANDDPDVVIQLAADSLGRGNSLIIFPEGTRSRRRLPLHFRRGAVNIAIRAGVDLRPVVLSCEPLTLGKDEAWYQIPERRFHYHMCVKDSVSIAEVLKDEPVHTARRLNDQLQSYFALESNWNGKTTQ